MSGIAKSTRVREYKSFKFQVKAEDDEQGLISAYGSVFGNVDQGSDIVEFGAFKRTIQNSKSRVAAGKAKSLAVMLWNHDSEHFLPVGSWYELSEDSNGLLGKGKLAVSTALGRDVYNLIKEGVINEFSIGYEVMGGGSYYEKGTGIRHLTELRLWEISPVIWAMNDEALLQNIKSVEAQMEVKSICGNTSGPIGPRDEAWDGSKAEKQIWEAAENEDGSIKASVAKKYFMVCNGEGDKKGDYDYPFWYVGEDPHICVGAVIAVAGAIGGARGAEAPDGLKGKVETLYSRINSKYPDASELKPKWKDDEKSLSDLRQLKTLMEHYNEELAEDLIEDWMDVYVTALTGALFDAFTIGDQPAQDISEALDAFKELVLSKFVMQALECDLSQYLADNDMSFNPAESRFYGDGPCYGWMSSRRQLARKQRKEMLAGDATTGGYFAGDGTANPRNDGGSQVQTHAQKLRQIVEKCNKAYADHVEKVHAAADEVKDLIGEQEKRIRLVKAGRTFSAANMQALADHAENLHDLADTHEKAMKRQMKAITNAADDIATAMQGAEEPVFGTGEGRAEDGQQEGKALALALREIKNLRN